MRLRDDLAIAVATALLLLAAAAPPPAAAAAPVWRWPVDGDRVVLRPFIAPPTPYGAGHRGVDLLADGGILLAPADGVVRFAGMVAGRPVLSIDHGGDIIVSAEPVSSMLVAGDAVARGDPIGEVLDGHCEQRCVHVGVRVDGDYANPLRWLGGAVRPILLPTRRPPPAGSAAAGSARLSGPAEPRRRPRGRDPATRTAPPSTSRATAR